MKKKQTKTKKRTKEKKDVPVQIVDRNKYTTNFFVEFDNSQESLNEIIQYVMEIHKPKVMLSNPTIDQIPQNNDMLLEYKLQNSILNIIWMNDGDNLVIKRLYKIAMQRSPKFNLIFGMVDPNGKILERWKINGCEFVFIDFGRGSLLEKSICSIDTVISYTSYEVEFPVEKLEEEKSN